MTKKMTSTSERYIEALNALDSQAYLDCFTADAELRDPYGGRPFSGHEGLAKWFAGMQRTWSQFHMTSIDQFNAGDRIALRWQVEATAVNGKEARFAGINIITVDQHGLITSLEGYWDAGAIMSQIA